MIVLAVTNIAFQQGGQTHQQADVELSLGDRHALVEHALGETPVCISSGVYRVPGQRHVVENRLTYAESRTDTQRVRLIYELGSALQRMGLGESDRSVFKLAVAGCIRNEGVPTITTEQTPHADMLNRFLRVVGPMVSILCGMTIVSAEGAMWAGISSDSEVTLNIFRHEGCDDEYISITVDLVGLEFFIRRNFPVWFTRWPAEGITLPFIEKDSGGYINTDLSDVLPPPVAQLN